MHTPVPIFAEEPKRMLKQFIENIMFVTYFTLKPEEHLFYINSHLPKSNCFRAILSKERINTSWNLKKVIESSQVTQVFKKFLDELNMNTSLRITFRTGGLISNSMEKVE